MTVERALRKLQFVIQQSATDVWDWKRFSFSPRLPLVGDFLVSISSVIHLAYCKYKLHIFYKYAGAQNSFAEGCFLSVLPFFGYEGRRFNEVFIKIRSGRIQSKLWASPRVQTARRREHLLPQAARDKPVEPNPRGCKIIFSLFFF